MKSAVAILLAICMICALFAGCEQEPHGQGSTSASTGATTQSSTTNTTATTQPATSETTQPPTIEVTQTATTEATQPSEPEPLIEPMVVFDTDGITITVTGITTDSLSQYGDDPELVFHVVNNSDKTVYISWPYDEASVNGIMAVAAKSWDPIPAGQTLEDTIRFDCSDLYEQSVRKIKTVSVYSMYIKAEEFGETLYTVEPFTVYVDRNCDEVQKYDLEGEVLYNADGVSIIAQGYKKTANGVTVNLCVKNDSGQDIRICTEDIIANGIIIDSYGMNFGMFVNAFSGTVCYGSINIRLPIEDYMIEGSGTPADVADILSLSFTARLMTVRGYHDITQSGVLTVETP